MNAQVAALDRIARVTSIIRTRVDDDRRHGHNGGTSREFNERVKAATVELRHIAHELEQLLDE